MLTPVTRIRSYEELDGAQGREVFFRPHRYRAADLAPLRCEVLLDADGTPRPCVLVDVSQNGAAVEWPKDLRVAVDDRIDCIAVRFDGHEAYRGEARVGSVRDVGGTTVVGISFAGFQVPMDDVLHLRSIRSFSERGIPSAKWRTQGQEEFKVLVSELRLFLEDASGELARLEAELPWHVLHGEGSPARTALIEQLRSGFVAELVRLTEEIDRAHRSAPTTIDAALREWSHRHLHEFFMQSPGMHRAASKPFGYPGDYEVMRFLYERPFEGTTLFSKAISLAFGQTRAARAVRNRKDLVKRRLKDLIEARERPLRILSVASGPAQELFEMLSEQRSLPAPIEIVLFDQDKGALAYACRRLQPLADAQHGARVKLVYLHDSIKRLLRESDLLAAFGRFDLIYSVGLFDYLRTTTAVQLARNLHARTAPGGATLIANMVPENPSRWYMEHHLEWHLLYRSRAELREIAERAVPGAHLQILEEESGVNPFVEMLRD